MLEEAVQRLMAEKEHIAPSEETTEYHYRISEDAYLDSGTSAMKSKVKMEIYRRLASVEVRKSWRI